MTTRRDFLQLGGAAALYGALGPMLDFERAAPLRILILGGTGFLGPHLVHAAAQRGHQLSMLNRGRREPSLFESDFARVEALQGDRSLPTGYDALKGRTWDVVIETSGYRHPWTREAAQALKGSAGRYVYVSSTGVHWPYRTVDIDENGPVPLTDSPPQEQPSYGVMKALSENEVRDAFPNGALIIRPGYIVGPGDTSDRWTYWPVRIARGGEVLVPGKKVEQVQYIDVRDLSEWMIRLLENNTTGTFNVTGPAQKQTMEQFVNGLAPLATTPVQWTWIDDYEWLKKYELRKLPNGQSAQLEYAVPWMIPEGTELGHMRINNRKAIAAGLTFRPLLTTGRDTVAWRVSDDVPAALKATPRYVMSAEEEKAMLAAWKNRVRGSGGQGVRGL